MQIIVKYDVKKLTSEDFEGELLNWFHSMMGMLNEVYTKGYNYKTLDLASFANHHCVWLCTRDNEPVGFMLASINRNFFDSSKTHIRQNLLFALPNTRAAYLLIKEFIDFGKLHVNYIDSTIAEFTNIKPETLEKLGFRRLEIIYRMEV